MAPGLFRTTAAPVALATVAVNHERVSVPPAAGLAFTASKTPMGRGQALRSRSPVTPRPLLAAPASTAPPARSPAAATQTGGSAHVTASQTITADDGSTQTTTMTAPFNFAAKPTGIASTSATLANVSGFYGGEFTHTFASPGGGQSALERSHVNERFAAASGTTLAITGTLGTLNITVNSPNDASGGWDLDAAGMMTGPDNVTWGNTIDARPFVVNASHPTPAATAAGADGHPGFPQSQLPEPDLRRRRHYHHHAPARHRRPEQPAQGGHQRQFGRHQPAGGRGLCGADGIPRCCRATPTSIPVATPAPAGGTAAAPTTSTIEVDAEGQTATPVFTVRAPELGCTITAMACSRRARRRGASPSAQATPPITTRPLSR
ncbi:hypothetical protein LP419_05850 [Massilia sp. H-1]|nr:hypothetical protein LP419_05850 [Massilia sp. H-1]